MRSLRPILPLLLFLTMLASTAKAQSRFRKPLKEPGIHATRYRDYHVGLKIGCPWSLLTKSDIEPRYLGRFGGELGVTAERSFQSLAVGLELLWAQRGTRMQGQSTYQQNLHDLDTLVFETAIAYDVVSLRTPITWYLMPPASNVVTPYLFVAPGIEHGLNKRLNLPADSLMAFIQKPFTTPTATYIDRVGEETHISQDTTWIPPYLNANIVAGMGVMVTIPSKTVSLHLKCDLGVNVGLLNLATKALQQQGVAIRSYGVEAGLTLVFDIQPPLRDACYTFQRKSLFSK